eukprot:756214-Hanusia_phi.AAC.6
MSEIPVFTSFAKAFQVRIRPPPPPPPPVAPIVLVLSRSAVFETPEQQHYFNCPYQVLHPCFPPPLLAPSSFPAPPPSLAVASSY